MSYYHVCKNLVRYSYIYILVILDLLNVYFINSTKLYNTCYKELKLAIFELGGECGNSGFCCNYIQIKYKGNWIKDKQHYHNVIEKDPIMKRFKPDYSITNKVNFFTCSSLSSTNTCLDYESRPFFCRVYPFSFFYSDDFIRPGCGYFIKQRYKLPSITSARIKQAIVVLKYNSHIL